MSEEPTGPNTPSVAYAAMVPEWDKMNALLGGTAAMRAKGKLYLPMHEREDHGSYRERLDTNVLFNMTKLTLDSWVGRPFSDPMVVGEKVPKEVVEDVDLQGNHIAVFGRGWFRDGLSKAFSHVIVDMPELPTLPEGQIRTLEDDRRENRRPYWVHVPPENLISARSEVRNGREVLTQVRILEEEMVPDGWGEELVRRIKVYTPGILRVYEEEQVSKEKTEWVLRKELPIDLPYIPLVTFYADRSGFMRGQSPMSDLADINIRHWQSQSDQNAILTVSRFAMLASSGHVRMPPRSGGKEEPTLEVGPHAWLHMDDAQGKFYYVEHTGKAIEAGRNDLLDLEEKMGAYGAQFLRRKPGSETATARALDSAEATSPLQDVTLRFVDAMNQALAITADWMKKPSDGWTVSLATDFGPEAEDIAGLDLLKQARIQRDISRKALLDEMLRRGILADDFDEEGDAGELEKENMAQGFGGKPTDGKDIDPFAAE